MTESSLRYGVSRNTGYKWLERHWQEGPRALLNRSRVPHSSPQQTPADIVQLIRDGHTRYGLGARKILKRLPTCDPKRTWPTRSTIFGILVRNGRGAATSQPATGATPRADFIGYRCRPAPPV